MDKDIEKLFKTYAESYGVDVSDLTDEYESESLYSELENGSFAQIGGGYEQVESWLKAYAERFSKENESEKRHKFAARKMIILTTKDTVELQDYEGYRSINKAVDGYYEICGRLMVEQPDKKQEVFLFCDEEFLLKEKEDDRVNAVATALCGQEIRGSVAVVPCCYTSEGKDVTGFKYSEIEIDGQVEMNFCETWFAQDQFMRFVNVNREALREIHKQLDNTKNKPFLFAERG